MDAPQAPRGAGKPSCCAIIPAYNEEARVGFVAMVACESGLFSEVVVVDDGSRDKTAEAAESAGARVITHELNRGKPQAMLSGLRATQGEFACFLDADLTGITAEHLADLIAPVVSGDTQATVGVFRGGRSATTLAHKITPMISGQRCLRRTLLDDFTDWDAGYGIETALNHHLRRKGINQQLVAWTGAGQVMKEQKVGFWRGVAWRMRMFWQIFAAWLRTKFAGRKR